MANQRAEIEVVVNGGQAKQSLNDIAKAVDGVAVSANNAGAKMGKIGDGADAGVAKAAAATKRFEEQLKRLNLELESGGKNTSAYISARAAAAGADGAALAPLLAQYDQLRAKQVLANSEFTKAGKVMTEYGMGVKATSAALRQVPAQFTDIIVSLQGGQAPLTVLLQQGGQLKDVFGGVGNAFKALSGYIIGLINPFTLLAGAAATVGVAYFQASKEIDAYNKALILSGNVTGVTAGQLQAISKTISTSTGASMGATAEALAQMAGSGKVAKGSLEALTESAIRFEKYAGVAVKDTVKAFSDLAKDPVSASVKLNEQYNYLTASVYEQIKALAEQGDKLGAAALAQGELANAQNRMANDMVGNLGRIEQALNLVTKAAKGAWNAVVGLFRVNTIDVEIAALEKMVANGGGIYDSVTGQTAKNQERLTYLKHLKASQDDYNRSQEKQAINTAAQIALDKQYETTLDKQARMRKEIAALSGQFNNGVGLNPEQVDKYAKAMQGIVDRYKDTGKAAKGASTAISEADKGLKLYNDLMAVSTGLTANFAEQQAQLTAKFAKDGNLDEYRKGMEAIIAKQPYMVESLKAEAEAIKIIEKARTDGLKSHANELDALNEKAQKFEDEVVMYGMSKEAIEELTTARMLDQIEVLRGFDNSAEEIARIEQVIAARKRLAAAGTALDLEKAAEKAGDDMLKEQKRAAEESGKYWEDALMRAFESGKSFFQSLWDTIKNTLKTQVLKIAVSATGLTGMSAANAGGMDGGIMGSLSSASSMFNTGSSLAGSIFASNAAYGAAIGTTSIGAGSQAAMLAAQTGEFGAAGLSATASAAGSGGMAALSTAMPYIAAAVLLYSVLHKDKTPTQGTGQATLSYDASGNLTNTYAKAEWGGLSAGANAAITGMQQAYFDTAKQLGITAASAQFTFGSNTGKDSKGNNFALGSSVNGAGYTSSGEIVYSEAALQLEASRAVFSALQASTLPGYLSKVFDGITASTATQEQIDSTLAFAGALKGLKFALLDAPQQVDYLQEIVNTGFATLGTSADTFKTDFLAAIEEGLTPANLADWQSLGSTMDALAASAKTAADELSRVQNALGSALQNIAKSIADMRSRALDADAGVLDAQSAIRDAYLTSQDAVAQAQARVNDLNLQAANAMRAFSRTIGDFLATISPSSGAGASLNSLKAQLSATAVLAQGGDANSQNSLLGQARQVLDTARAGSRSAVEYARSEAFVRSLLTGVQSTVTAGLADAPAEQTAAQQLADATAALVTAQATSDRYAELALATNTNILASTDVVGDEIARLATAYETATAEREAANLQLGIALAALDVLGLTEQMVNALANGQVPNETTGDFALALNVSNEDIAALQSAIGFTDEDLQSLRNALNVSVQDDVREYLAGALGIRQDDVIALESVLQQSPIWLLDLVNTMALPIEVSDEAKALTSGIALTPETADIATGLNAGVGLTPDAALIATGLNAGIGLTPDAAAIATAINEGIGLTPATEYVATLLNAGVALTPETAAIATQLNGGLGFTDEALLIAGALPTAVGIRSGVLEALGGALGLNQSAIDAIAALGAITAAQLSGGTSNADRVTNAYAAIGRTGFGSAGNQIDTAGYDYWMTQLDTGAVSLADFQNKFLQAAATYTGSTTYASAKALADLLLQQGIDIPGFATGTSYVPRDMTARIHQGEEITPRPYVDAQRQSRDETNALLARLLKSNEAMAKELAEIKANSVKTEASSKKTSDTLVRVTRDGNSLITTAA